MGPAASIDPGPQPPDGAVASPTGPFALGRGIVGHDDAVSTLERSLGDGRVAHAYLFAGPPGVGKGTLARTLAKALNCRARPAPCDACSVCRRIDAAKHPDVELIHPGGICDEQEHDHSADSGTDLRICQVRRAERVLGIAPFEGGRRVLIVDPADSLNAQAADAFLKTLEEPPNGAVILLVTSAEASLSETIRSRCRTVRLHALTLAETNSALIERFGVSPEDATRLARIFGGRLGATVEASRDPAFAERRRAIMQGAYAVAGASLFERFAEAGRLADAFAKRAKATEAEEAELPPADGKARSRADVFATLDHWIAWWRDLLLTLGGAGAEVVDQDAGAGDFAAAGGINRDDAARGITALRDARRDLERNVNPRLALEALMLRLPQRQPAGGRQRAAPATIGREAR